MSVKKNQITRRKFVASYLVAGVILSGVMFPATAAFADQLNDLRLSGAVGEAFDGFARARKDGGADFVKEVNKKRRSIYVKRAKSQGAAVDQVGRVYASQIAKSAPAGTWFLSESGSWTQKK